MGNVVGFSRTFCGFVHLDSCWCCWCGLYKEFSLLVSVCLISFIPKKEVVILWDFYSIGSKKKGWNTRIDLSQFGFFKLQSFYEWHIIHGIWPENMSHWLPFTVDCSTISNNKNFIPWYFALLACSFVT